MMRLEFYSPSRRVTFSNRYSLNADVSTAIAGSYELLRGKYGEPYDFELRKVAREENDAN